MTLWIESNRADPEVVPMPDLFHTYCEEHPEWGTCTPEAEAHEEIAAHLRKAHTEGKLNG